MTSLTARVRGIGLLGPGLTNWSTGGPALAGAAPYVMQPTVLPTPTALPPAERRRTGSVVKLALAIGFEATSRAQIDPGVLPTVFTSSGGDGYNCHEICQTLASSDRQLSPTRFHNSVHNAASGYWSIAANATPASSVLCAFDASFGAGLLESLTQVAVDRTSVLLIAYDAGYPEPMRARRPIPDAFGVAMVLEPVDTDQHSAPPSDASALARPMSTGPTSSGETSSRPVPSDSVSSGSLASGRVASRSVASSPLTSTPTPSGSLASGPTSSGPKRSGPLASGPAASGPAASSPMSAPNSGVITNAPAPIITATLTDAPPDILPDAQLEALRAAIPAARSLPLLTQLARLEPGRVVLDYLEEQRIAIEVSVWR